MFEDLRRRVSQTGAPQARESLVALFWCGIQPDCERFFDGHVCCRCKKRAAVALSVSTGFRTKTVTANMTDSNFVRAIKVTTSVTARPVAQKLSQPSPSAPFANAGLSLPLHSACSFLDETLFQGLELFFGEETMVFDDA